MTAREQDPVKATFAGFGERNGFRRKSNAWYLPQAETIAVLDLQKSQYGPQYYANVALWLLPLGDAATPKEGTCQIRTRLTSLFPDSQD